MKVEFSSQSGRDGVAPEAQTGRLLNCFREPLIAGGKAGYQIRSVLGMQGVTMLDRVFMRGLMEWAGGLMLICGGHLITCTTAGASTVVGALGDSEYAGLAENTGYATIVSSGKFWHYDGTDLTEVGFDYDLGSVAYLGGYTIVTEKGGRRFAWSDLADPTTFGGLSFASAEVNNDPIIRAVVVKDTLLLFKSSGIEYWGVTGSAGSDAFARISGAMEETGLAGFHLLTAFPNGMAFVGTDGRVNIWAGGIRPISIPPVESAIETSEPLRMFYYEMRGHSFICLTFRDCPAWCYDIATGEWHERSESEGAWTLAGTERINGVWYGATDTGVVVKLAKRCEDYGGPLVRRVVSLPFANGKPFRVASLAAYVQTGRHIQHNDETTLNDGDALLSSDNLHPLGWYRDESPAKIGLRTTRDGVSFGPVKVRELGHIGQRNIWVQWRNLGQFRRMCAFELSLSGPDDIPLLSTAEAEIN